MAKSGNDGHPSESCQAQFRLAGLLPLQLQFSEDFALNVVPRSWLRPFGIKFALNSRAVREDSMTEATSRAGMKRAVRGREAVPVTTIGKIEADGVQVFYRAAGDPNAPVVLLLHGFPTSSFMFRELIPRLANDNRVIAPDLPGFGFTRVPAERKYVYSFDQLADTIDAFTRALKIDRYAIYLFDYGAPTGFRLAIAHPDRVTADPFLRTATRTKKAWVSVGADPKVLVGTHGRE